MGWKLLIALTLLTTPAWAYEYCVVDKNETYHYRLDFDTNGVNWSQVDNNHDVAYWKLFLAGSDGDYRCEKCLVGDGKEFDATLTFNQHTGDFVFRIWADKTMHLMDMGKCA